MGEKAKGSPAKESNESLAQALLRLKGGELPKRVEGQREGAKLPSRPFDRSSVKKG